ncbi:TIGR01777 family protein [Peribacillus saganii]|uniref:TIGR01777 family protein n=1 Tax=Peribacillus saganii TaxID=2303992 RepID=A0A372LJ75_9BACI|nr:TIGR01777 family oxidoreductase [Peribacillus saganii]RFU66457.1 TIGR01777 family protein [Peribacillus saganii]
MKKKVVLAGGTGFIGEYFRKKFLNLGYDIKMISRHSAHISWDNEPVIIEALENAEILINLAGKSVNCRYTTKNKHEIMKSRIETTNILGKAVLACQNPPRLWINSSTATIYRHAEDRPMTETDGEIGKGFSVDVAKAWEKAFFAFNLPHTRQIALRIAIVLGPEGGVMTPYKNLVRFGLGGKQGSGDQRFSWIHVEDLFRIVLFLHDKENISGVINCSAPEPLSNRELMNQLRIAMHVPFGLPSPKWLLELGAVVINTETELVLKSRWVIPERLESQGYEFTFPKLQNALDDILHNERKLTNDI